MNARPPAQTGFTVIELLIVLVIGGILAAITVPGMRDALNNTRQSSTLGLVMSDLNQARGEAIKRNVRMLVCASNAAADNCSGGTNWAVGWLVCWEGTIANQCANPTADNPNPVVVRPALNSTLTLTASAAVIRFSPNSSSTSGNLTLGGTWPGAINRTVAVAVTGNISK